MFISFSPLLNPNMDGKHGSLLLVKGFDASKKKETALFFDKKNQISLAVYIEFLQTKYQKIDLSL